MEFTDISHYQLAAILRLIKVVTVRTLNVVSAKQTCDNEFIMKFYLFNLNINYKIYYNFLI